MMRKTLVILTLCFMMVMSVFGCGTQESGQVELTISAAASLTDAIAEIQTAYEESNPDVTLNITLGSSGSLQAQIEQGAEVDVFISAALKQMVALQEDGYLLDDSYEEILENKVVLIAPENSTKAINSFEDVLLADISLIGIGEPSSVPAGEYAQQVFESLGIWDDVSLKSNFGSDVRVVLTWVENSEVDCGVVYKTDAMTSSAVKIVAEAPEGSCNQIIYPGAILSDSEYTEEAADFIEFLSSETAKEIFESYGFAVIE